MYLYPVARGALPYETDAVYLPKRGMACWLAALCAAAAIDVTALMDGECPIKAASLREMGIFLNMLGAPPPT